MALHGSGIAPQDSVIGRRLVTGPPACPQGSGFPLSAVPTRAWESHLSRKISSFSIWKSFLLPPLPPPLPRLSVKGWGSAGLWAGAHCASSPPRGCLTTRSSSWPGLLLGDPHSSTPAPLLFSTDSPSCSPPALAPPQPAKGRPRAVGGREKGWVSPFRTSCRGRATAGN